MLLGHGRWIFPGNLFKHSDLAVAIDKLHRDTEVEQICECFTRHRTRKHIAPDHHVVYSYLTNLFEHSFQSREVCMDIVDGCDQHEGTFSKVSLVSRYISKLN